MTLGTVLADGAVTELSKELFKHYTANENYPTAEVPDIRDLKTFITRLIKNGFGDIDMASPDQLTTLLGMIILLKGEKKLGGIRDFISKIDIVSLRSSCLGGVADSRPREIGRAHV